MVDSCISSRRRRRRRQRLKLPPTLILVLSFLSFFRLTSSSSPAPKICTLNIIDTAPMEYRSTCGCSDNPSNITTNHFHIESPIQSCVMQCTKNQHIHMNLRRKCPSILQLRSCCSSTCQGFIMPLQHSIPMSSIVCLNRKPECYNSLISFRRFSTSYVGATCSCKRKEEVTYPVVRRKVRCMQRCLRVPFATKIFQLNCASNLRAYTNSKVTSCCQRTCGGKIRKLKVTVRRRRRRRWRRNIWGCGNKYTKKKNRKPKRAPGNFNSKRTPSRNAQSMRRRLTDILRYRKRPVNIRVEAIFKRLDFVVPEENTTLTTLEQAENEEASEISSKSANEDDESNTEESEVSSVRDIEMIESYNEALRTVSTECLANQCGSRVTITSARHLRNIIVLKAIRKLTKTPGFDSVYQTGSSRILIRKKRGRRFFVFIPFNNQYILEF